MMKARLKKIFCDFKSGAGFTLIEVLIVLALTGIVMSSVYGIYISTMRAASVDETRLEIQQAQRFSMDFLMRELRHIGYDPDESQTNPPTLVAGGTDYIYFTADMNGDGDLNDANEHICFCIYTDTNGRRTLGYLAADSAADVNAANIDANNDGFSDLGHTHPAPSHQGLSTIEALEFNYKTSSGTTTTTPTLDGIDFDDVREIDVSMLTRSDNSDPKYDASQLSFQTASGTVWNGFGNDGFQRMLLVSTVRLRNMGL